MIQVTRVLLFLFLGSQVFAASDPGDLLPDDNAVKGWKQSTTPKIYKHTQLWEYINGGADVYLDYGFQSVGTVDLSSGKRTVVVDIYDMKNPEGAFGMYAKERAPTYSFIAIGAHGYRQGVALNFYQDRYYVKLTAFSDDQRTRKALLSIGKAVSKKIGRGKNLPAILAIFPGKGKKKHTETYEIKKYLGCTGLRNTYTAQYSLSGVKFTAFISKSKSESAAASRFRSCRKCFKNVDAKAEGFSGLTELAIIGASGSGKTTLLRSGKYLIGIHPVGNVKTQRTFLKGFLKNLK